MTLNSSKETERNHHELEITVGEEEFSPAVDRAFRKNIGRINVPGFRRGKAPKSVVYKMYGEEMFYEDAVNMLYPKALDEALEEAKLEPVVMPEVTVSAVDKSGFTFTAKVVTKPEVELSGYKGIKVEKPVKNVGEELVDAELDRRRRRNARLVTVEGRPAQSGDTVIIDYEGSIDGVPFDGGKDENHTLRLGSGTFIPGFEDQVAGHQIDEPFELQVTFPEEYYDQLKGKDAVFKVVIHQIQEEQLPEADDDFAQDVSEFDTLAELRADIREKLKENEQKRADSVAEDRLMDELVERMTCDIPNEMVEVKMDELLRNYEYRLRLQGIPLNDYIKFLKKTLEEFREEFRDPAVKQLRYRLALEQVAKLEDIQPTAEEIEAEFQKVADQGRRTVEEMKKVFSEKDIAADVAVTKALDLLKESAEITEVPFVEPSGDDSNEAE